MHLQRIYLAITIFVVTVWVGTSSPAPSFWTVPIAGGPGIRVERAPAVQSKLDEASMEGEAGQQLGDYTTLVQIAIAKDHMKKAEPLISWD